MNKKLWVVLGMHRSGTSVLSRALAVLGAEHGDKSQRAGSDNPRGFWEDEELVAFNDELLAELGQGWFDLAPVDAAIFEQPAWQAKKAQARALFEKKLSVCQVFALKDPRFSRLLPFWRPLWREWGLSVSYLFSLREPEAVAHSLQHRNGFRPGYSAALWLRYIQDGLAGLGDEQALMVDYQRLLHDPKAVLTSMAGFLGAEVDARALEVFSNDFLEVSLDHGKINDAGPLLAQAKEVYLRLCSQPFASSNLLPLCTTGPVGDWQHWPRESRHNEALLGAGSLLQQSAQYDQALFDINSQFPRIDAQMQEVHRQHQQYECWLKQQSATQQALLEQNQQLTAKDEDYRQQLQTLNTQIQQLQQAQLDLLSRFYWKRKLAKRWLLAASQRCRPLLAPAFRKLPPALKQSIKNRLERRLFSVATAAASRVEADSALLAAVRAAGEGSDVVVFPVIDWSFRIQRPQHLARELAAAGRRVFYLSTTFNPAREPGFVLLEQPAENVFLCQLNLAAPHPVIYQDVPEGDMLLGLRRSLNVLARQVALRQPVAIIDLPFWHRVADALPGALQVYDCMDHHAGFSTNSEQMHGLEQQLLHEADLVVTTASRLSGIVGQERENIIIRNGAEVAFFSTPCEQRLYQSERPVVGYYGAISEWFDMELVIASARAYPQWDFVLVGNTFGCDTKAAEKLPNIHFTGEVSYTDLPGYLAAFDVCTIPFKLVELTLCTNPVKVYEYLAAGKPVVATAMPELKLIDDQLHVAEDEAGYIAALASAMDEAGNKALASERSAWAQQHDWASRAIQLQQAIDDCYPKVSVIVLTYNNLELTRACLSSIERYSDYPNLELVLVDNASSDDTPEFLRDYAAGKNNVKLCLNDDNLGFSAGNNVGLAAATGDYLVILNNDTYVTQGWVHGLVRALKRHPELGLVGPVTNNIGNEARINIQYANMDQMAEQAAQYTQAHAGEIYPARCAAFFCVMFSRETYQAVGPMDEEFGVGFFEDDDYCNRVRQQGLEIGIVDDVFVHHHLSASFNKLKAGAKQALFERNKAIYESKWGAWEPHNYRPGVQ